MVMYFWKRSASVWIALLYILMGGLLMVFPAAPNNRIDPNRRPVRGGGSFFCFSEPVGCTTVLRGHSAYTVITGPGCGMFSGCSR